VVALFIVVVVDLDVTPSIGRSTMVPDGAPLPGQLAEPSRARIAEVDREALPTTMAVAAVSSSTGVGARSASLPVGELEDLALVGILRPASGRGSVPPAILASWPRGRGRSSASSAAGAARIVDAAPPCR
jgi:hypothetical protein